MTSAVVLVAAGLGRRLGDAGPKALIQVAGKALLDHVLERVRAANPDEIVVVATPGEERRFEAVADPYEVDALVPGGDTRSASVRAGVAALGPGATVVAIHDAARAFTPAAVIRAAIEAVRAGAIAAAPGLPVVDTLKRVRDGEVVGTVGRHGLRAIQTPQAFRREVLEQVLAASDEDATDDLALVERARDDGLVTGTIRLVPGSVRATKITYPEDLALAALLARTATP